MYETPTKKKMSAGTTDNTPFTKLSYQPYYAQRQTIHRASIKKVFWSIIISLSEFLFLLVFLRGLVASHTRMSTLE